MKIEIRGLSKSFKAFKVLDNIRLTIGKGEIFGILGPNGAGKSTLIKITLGIYEAPRGCVFVNDIDVCSSNYIRVKKQTGFLLDNISLIKSFSAWDNVEFFDRIYFKDDTNENRKKRIHRVLQLFGLDTCSQKQVIYLSRGMKQRVALARALINNPQLLILDEPNRGMDREGKVILKKLLIKLAEKGTTIVITSHELEDLSLLVQKAVYMDKGKILGETWIKNKNRMDLLEFYDSHVGLKDVEDIMI
ncbi:MAG: ABC transporter ATP-binding protein [Holosporales bacterium]|jgi:ABC-2 type transport system ATP-binding protein|nr:ABC transporter ATP-binding protein [Holosporales bacterium]